MESTFYWHDYETWGTNPAVDRACQFAGVRTDENLNIVGDPLVVYSRPPPDILPQPEACLVTGITPTLAQEKGLSEAEFIHCIYQELCKPNTCTVGYNSLRFDDEVTRYTLYRNYYDPYEREWRNGNSRWDIIDMVRLVYALRPEGIEWPMVDGKPSFKLESLSKANGLTHSSAHDAYSDVEATIALAKLIKEKKPSLYHYTYTHKSKHSVAKSIDIKSRKPLLHVSSRFPSERGCCGLVVPIAAHPTNKNAVIVYELSVDPAPLETLSVSDIRRRIFSKREDLSGHEHRLPVKLIHLNRCPILLPVKMLDEAAAKRLNIDKDLCEQHWRSMLKMEIEYKMRQVYENEAFEPKSDAEQQLYQGFIHDEDKSLMPSLRQEDPAEINSARYHFRDTRLNDMLLAYKARNYPDALSSSEHEQWKELVIQRLRFGEKGMLSIDEFKADLALLCAKDRISHRDKSILTSLREYITSIEKSLELAV